MNTSTLLVQDVGVTFHFKSPTNPMKSYVIFDQAISTKRAYRYLGSRRKKKKLVATFLVVHFFITVLILLNMNMIHAFSKV